MLNAFEDIGDKVKDYLSLAARRGIKILPPDVNRSMDRCTVEDGCIRLGLHAVSGLNKLSRTIMKVRKEGPFTDFQDFYDRMSGSDKLNKQALTSLISAGAFDGFGLNHRQLDELAVALDKNFKNKAEATARALGQFCMFSEEERKVPVPQVPEYDKPILMEREFKAVGFYLTDHPVDLLYSKLEDPSSYRRISELASLDTPLRTVSTIGLIKDLRGIYTKKEEEMFLFSVEDRFSSLRCVMFPSRVAANRHRLQEGAVVKIVGEFAIDEEHGRQLIIGDLFAADEIAGQKHAPITVTIRTKAEQERLLAFLAQAPGTTPVQICTNGRMYPLKQRLRVSPYALDYLRSNFPKVNA